MKFPKSLHAEGWSSHIETTPGEPKTPAAKRRAGAKIDINSPLHDPAVTAGPLHAAKPAPIGTRLDAPHVAPALNARPAVEGTRAPRAAALPPRSGEKLGWMIGAGAGAAVIAAVAVWAVNRPADMPNTPPALVTGSTEPQAEVAAATPVPESATAAEDSTTSASVDTTATTTTAAAEPEHLGPPVTTVKPAAEPRPVAAAPVTSPRPELVVRANPRDSAPQPERTPYLQPSAPVAAAPVEVQPLAVTPGTAPIELPPTAAGPVAAPAPQVTPPEVTPQPVAPVAVSPTPDPAVTSTSPGTPPLAQVPLPAADDSGITVKVRSALAADSTLAAVPISVTTEQGVVKLEGQAPDSPTRERATVVAASTSGVKAVDNRLTLASAPVVSQLSVNR